MSVSGVMVFTGLANPELARDVATYLNLPLGKAEASILRLLLSINGVPPRVMVCPSRDASKVISKIALPPLGRSAITWRSEPGPLSFVVVAAMSGMEAMFNGSEPAAISPTQAERPKAKAARRKQQIS